MPLATGSRLGPYEIGSRIGAGGMGEVFRARDTRLGRDVAIKILPPAYAQDHERVARFRREAQLVASLNHPNIAAIHGLEESNGVVALALELVEGEDLAQRLKRGAIPVDEVLAIACQLAEGLEAAHEKGIIHRDLKPANIKLSGDGAVKILDFGLAKAFEDDASSSDADFAQSPTLSRHMTEAGTILGTAAYMSPEQARGKAVDKRSDIWSFGVVLVEMLTGRRLFRGETVSDTLAAVLRDSVDLSTLPAETPHPLRRVLERCLERDPKRRLRDIGEVRVALSDPSSGSGAMAQHGGASHARPRRVGAAVAAALLFAGVTALASVWTWKLLHSPAPPQVTRFTIPLPAGEVLAGNSGPAISRDGRTLAYVARDTSGVSRLFVRPLDRLEPVLVPESETAQQPFFSPDGKKIGFFARGKLMIAAVSGGAPAAIADASYQPFGGAWGEDGTIVYVPTLMSGLVRIAASGGKPRTMTEPDGAAKGYAHVFPQFLPGRDTVLFAVWGGRNLELCGAGTIDLDAVEWKTHPAPISLRQFSHATSGHLLSSAPRGIAAIPYAADGPPRGAEYTTVVEDVFSSPNIVLAWYAASDNGTLVYVPGDPNLGSLAWVDRHGVVAPLAGRPETFVDPALSPDGTRVVVGQGPTLWVRELRRGTLTRLTVDGEGYNMVALWSPDGKRVIFASNRSGDWDLYSISASGGPATRILERKGIQFPLSFAPDGTLLFSERTRGTGTDFWLLAPDGTVQPFLVSPFSKVGGQFSPDGRAVAYVSDETGREEVYVRSVERPGEVVAVSTEGGMGAMWSPDGKWLFYRRGESFLAASVTTTGSLSAGDPQKLFDLRAANGRSPQNPGYAVSPDGNRFLVLVPDARAIPTQINVVLNWFEELKAKVPVR